MGTLKIINQSNPLNNKRLSNNPGLIEHFYTGTLKLICNPQQASGCADCKGHTGPSRTVGTLIYLIPAAITRICTLVKLITCTCKAGLVHYMVNYTSIKLVLKDSKDTKSKPDPMRSLLREQFLVDCNFQI